VIDLIGYRKAGHNELDQPMFTQPLMYKRIAQMKPVSEKYEDQLVAEGVLTKEQGLKMRDHVKSELEKAYEASKTHKPTIEEWRSEEWEGIKDVSRFGKDTGLTPQNFKQIGDKITILPDDWNFHPTVKRIYETRQKSIKEGKSIDWGTAEALAFASLIDEGFHVRISGQDVERGTFSHRHAVVFDQEKDQHYVPMNSIAPNAQISRFQVCNSHLSEYAVLGYEYGYAQSHPNTLTIWEAQFGDFSNGAQIVIDTMIASGEAKWNVKQGLVMLLPHGYDGQGPEHSSCRIERYLQLSDESDVNDHRKDRVNLQVVNATTAANFFHLLRRQMRRPFRKPLVVASPKKLLKYNRANSDQEEFTDATRFKKIYVDQNKNLVAPEKVKKVILCSGQVYYDIDNARTKEEINDVAVIRVEQLSPFPFKAVTAQLQQYKNASVQWV
jgi:2-oxoglutarate dehydrogenase E1 component